MGTIRPTVQFKFKFKTNCEIFMTILRKQLENSNLKRSISMGALSKFCGTVIPSSLVSPPYNRIPRPLLTVCWPRITVLHFTTDFLFSKHLVAHPKKLLTTLLLHRWLFVSLAEEACGKLRRWTHQSALSDY